MNSCLDVSTNSTPNNRDFKTQWAETAKDLRNYVGGKENNSANSSMKVDN